jgi:nucleoside phosphorylase
MRAPRPARLDTGSELSLDAQIDGLPPLPAIDWQAADFTAPLVLDTPAALPPADVVVIAWAEAEWAALQHVFCASSLPMPYSDRNTKAWPGWQEDSTSPPAGNANWGYFRLVRVGATPVLLYKSNTHYSHHGGPALSALTGRLIDGVKPKLIMSTGTAGGTNDEDHVGTVVIVKAATLYEADKPSGAWPTYGGSPWTAPTAKLDTSGFAGLLMAIPITATALQQLADRFNNAKHTSYTLAQLDPMHLNLPGPTPAVRNLSGGDTSLLTASSFLVGTTDNALAAYGCIEMDDAIVAAECEKEGTPYCSVRNLSDPAQNPQLKRNGGDWGTVVYEAYGFYTSFNGALAAWATIA